MARCPAQGWGHKRLTDENGCNVGLLLLFLVVFIHFVVKIPGLKAKLKAEFFIYYFNDDDYYCYLL